jgi:hypothetical protein
MFITDWFNFLLDIGNSVEPYITLIIFSIWLSFISRREDHLLSYVSFLEAVAGFLMVIIAVSMFKVNVTIPNIYLFYTFLSYVGILWGVQGITWGIVFFIIPIERILRIDSTRKKGRKFTYF